MFRILEYQSHLTSQHFHRKSISINAFSIIENVSVSRLKKSIQMLGKCRFTGTGMPDQTDKFSILNGQIYIFQRILLKDRILTIYMIQIFDFNCHIQNAPFRIISQQARLQAPRLSKFRLEVPYPPASAHQQAQSPAARPVCTFSIHSL